MKLFICDRLITNLFYFRDPAMRIGGAKISYINTMVSKRPVTQCI